MDINFKIFENPSYIKFTGKGDLFMNEFSLMVDFWYYLINETAILFCKSNTQLPLSYRLNLMENKWRLIGKTFSNKDIHIHNLVFLRSDGKMHFEFIHTNSTIIGPVEEYKLLDSVNYHVFNLFLKDLNFEYNGYQVEIKSRATFEHELISKFWQIPQIGAEIKLRKRDEPFESYLTLINSILILLNLALGKSLSMPINDLEKDGCQTTLISNARPTDRKIQSIIREDDICEFLKITLPYFKDDFDKKYKEFRTILEYINSTDIGYLDDRVLSIIQAYEILALRWSIRTNLPQEFELLKNNLKKVVTEWHKDYPQHDKGMISQRVCDSLSWDKTSSKLEILLDRFNFDKGMMQVDFKSLVKWRHKVAHEGMLKSEDNDEVADKLLDAQFVIKLLLLRIVGYNDRVLPNNGYDKGNKVRDFFLD